MPTPHQTYERASTRYWSDKALDARMGTNYAAESVVALRAAWAALVAAKGLRPVSARRLYRSWGGR